MWRIYSVLLTTDLWSIIEAVRIISQDDGPLHLDDTTINRQTDLGDQEFTTRSDSHEDRQTSWSKLFRQGIKDGLYKQTDKCCYNIPANTPLALAANQGSQDASACTCRDEISEEFVKAPGFLQSSDAEIYRRAESMTSDQRAELQEKLTEKKWKWPDDLNSKGPKASKDKVPEPKSVSLSDSVEQAITRAKEELASALTAPRDIKPFVYPLMVREIARLLFTQGCERDLHNTVCPISWTLRVSGVVSDDPEVYTPTSLLKEGAMTEVMCEPPAAYRGLCGSLNFENLLDRTNATVLTSLENLGRFCWFEFPCKTSPSIQWDLPCPNQFRALSDSDETEICLRKANALGRCAPIISTSWSNVREKVQYRISCDEPWPNEAEASSGEEYGYVADGGGYKDLFYTKFGGDLTDDNGPIWPQ